MSRVIDYRNTDQIKSRPPSQGTPHPSRNDITKAHRTMNLDALDTKELTSTLPISLADVCIISSTSKGSDKTHIDLVEAYGDAEDDAAAQECLVDGLVTKEMDEDESNDFIIIISHD